MAPKNVVVTGKTQRRISQEEFAKAIGAEPMSSEQAADWVRRHGGVEQHLAIQSAKQQPKPVSGQIKVEWTCPVCGEAQQDEIGNFVKRGANLETQCVACRTDVPVEW